MLLGTPLPRESFAKGGLDLVFLHPDIEKVFDHTPEFIFRQMGFHIVDDTSFHHDLVMIISIDQVLNRWVH